MLFENIGVIDQDFNYRANQYVATAGDRIAYVGATKPADAERFGERYDGAGKLLMPALYNAHAHAPMTLLRGYAENEPLHKWLNETVWPYEAKMTADDNYWATALACAEMARFGTAGFSDMYYHTEARARAVAESGLKANLSYTPIAFEPKDVSEYPYFAEMEDTRKSINESVNGRLKIDACVHAEYTNNDVTGKSIVEWAREYDLRLHIHLSETESEVADCKARHQGLSPVSWFESIGAFQVPVVAAHCVWVNDNDIETLARNNVFVAHNPASNMKLASGFAPVSKMLDAGVTVALGTDGMASNNNHDMFQDMYLMSLLPKGFQRDPSLIAPKQVLFAATRAGALAQGRQDCGLVKEGFKADIAVLDVSGPAWAPVNDMLTNVVYAAHGNDVVLTMVDGSVVYRDDAWPFIDVERAKFEVGARTVRIQQELAQQ